jgi:4-hydroxymandelate oxidase
MTTSHPPVDPQSLYSLDEFEALAVERMAPPARAMVQQGAGDGLTIRANRDAWRRWLLRPRALVDVSHRDLSTTILGQKVSMPVLVAPSGLHGLVHPDAECATAAAARQAGTLMVLSMGASLTIEQVAAVGAPFWFQCYWGEDRERLRDLVQLAAAAGCRALCLTVDLPVRPWLSTAMRVAMAGLAEVKPAYMDRRTVHVDPHRKWEHDARLTWRDLEWLRAVSPLPLALKGIMTGEDAALAADHGVDAVIVSNHGGRTLDEVAATADALPEIVTAAAGRLQVLVDGGIRQGADVAKALALGADAVLVGRPALWGLAVAGAAGTARVLDILRQQLDSAMGFVGARTLNEITPDRIGRRP